MTSGTAQSAPRPAEVTAAIESLAARQHGVVTRRQLMELGLSEAAIGRRMAAGALRPLHRGIYRMGPLQGARSGEMAAVLSGGPTALLSYTSALEAWRVIGAGSRRPFHVTVVGPPMRRRPGVVFHRVRSLVDGERTVLDGIPITSPLRALVDSASLLGSRELAKAVGAAERMGLVGPSELAAVAARYRGRRGMSQLGALVRADLGRPFTRSEAEDRCLALLRQAGLPSPHTNVPVGPYELDFFWPDANVAVEVDGWAFHGTRPRFENDRKKDNWLRGRGIEVIRLTWRQITREPLASAVQVGQALALARDRARVRVRPNPLEGVPPPGAPRP